MPRRTYVAQLHLILGWTVSQFLSQHALGERVKGVLHEDSSITVSIDTGDIFMQDSLLIGVGMKFKCIPCSRMQSSFIFVVSTVSASSST